MADVGVLGGSLDQYAMSFVDRTRQLKSLVLLRSSQPSEQTDQVTEGSLMISCFPKPQHVH